MGSDQAYQNLGLIDTHWHDLVDTGLPADNVSWATDVYRSTVEQQIGTPLYLWGA